MALGSDDIIKIVKMNIKVEKIECTDFSEAHKNHAEAQKSGGGHYQLLIVSEEFSGLSRLQRQRRIMKLFQEHFSNNEIHALSIQAKTPTEP